MAHTKSQKTTRGNKDSVSKRLGVKIYGNQKAKVGNVIIRQRGTKCQAGEGTRLGRDYTIYAVVDGIVQFKKRDDKQYVSVVPRQ
ncbi:50S ribosomal protein L27 [Candidatus Roizmanbacteria bacterium RIFCSPHIGHO2_02_FULL_37_13b]|uniref:Large ribosomal subunit protein bL27 n=1 Tax=Candidatus Roizmanbacteria bacterium RIFCSPLOWO2_02_FULL_36_11 TaxID=1802071 RepID=A0A1F7JGA5_9BACT|nr:MAG: 50S ribosomal protein L27 [Candidatus Roizmanbacteria bacterium RIFCSPHIGHO2_02_FULL_37_13b]OGK54586.1 MAG: 50S ribosomal protein L27 [Candidatus Roizmanbacteria bacterium RIFCSPLOWO2_02_FULL_36_11]